MIYTPRPYQAEAIDANVAFFTEHMTKSTKYNALQILPTGSGKSVVIANTVGPLPGKTVVFQPSKEILKQNFEKYISYGFRAGIYSASANMKYVDTVTYAMIGSVVKKPHIFNGVRNIIIDECHLVNADAGMYLNFIKAHPQARVLGLTATPYRLTSSIEGAMLKFLNRTIPRIFNKVNYYVQNQVLFDAGHLAPLDYYNFDVIDRNKLELNKSGSDFTDESFRQQMRAVNLPAQIAKRANQILEKRRSLLVFCTLVKEAYEVASMIPGAVVVHGELPDVERDRILKAFKSGQIRCVVNCKVLDTGFDYPGLEAVLIGRSTMSLALWYQMVGRVMRIFQYPDGSWKRGWVVDMGGNLEYFGKVETMRIEQTKSGLYYITNNGRQLTNVAFRKK